MFPIAHGLTRWTYLKLSLSLPEVSIRDLPKKNSLFSKPIETKYPAKDKSKEEEWVHSGNSPPLNGPFAASDHMVHAGGQAAHWDIQNKENSNLS